MWVSLASDAIAVRLQIDATGSNRYCPRLSMLTVGASILPLLAVPNPSRDAASFVPFIGCRKIPPRSSSRAGDTAVTRFIVSDRKNPARFGRREAGSTISRPFFLKNARRLHARGPEIETPRAATAGSEIVDALRCETPRETQGILRVSGFESASGEKRAKSTDVIDRFMGRVDSN